MSFLLLLFVVPRAFAGDECEDCLDMSCSEDCEFARSRWLRRCVPPDIVFFREEREEIPLVKMKKIHTHISSMITSTHNMYQSGAAWNVRCSVYVLHATC